MPQFAMQQRSTPSYESSGGRLVSVDGRTLPLLGAHVRAEARGGIARVTLQQRFKNPYAEPLQVTYTLPLPADGAVSGFAFVLGDRRIVGEVDRKKAARERFEQAILEGRTAGIVDQERSSVFTQELGNVPPGAEIVAELLVDQKLAWLPEGAWEWRFPTVVAPRYLGAEGSVPDADKITVDVADGQTRIAVSMELTIHDRLADGQKPESPSHTVRAEHGLSQWDVVLTDEAARRDRDLVVRWAAAAATPGVSVAVARPAAGKPHATSAYGLVTLIPPAPRFEPEALPRDLIVLLDTSGSMSGQPLDQARRVVSALIDTLTEQDQLELIEFSNSPRRWKSNPVAMGPKQRKDALSWLAALHASGGTEMYSGIMEALAPLREDAQRQVVLVTDGLIGSEAQVLEAILQRLPSNCRVHTVGIGSGVNRSLTQPAARAGRGVELVIGLGEDAERAARRLVARTNAPLITGLSVSGSALEATAPQRLPDVFAGAPALISVRLKAEGGLLVLRGTTAQGAFEDRLTIDRCEPGQGEAALCALYAREAVEDLELAIAGGAPKRELDPQIEKVGVSFQISTRLTSWVAVSEQVTVDPTAATRKETIPQELPYGMNAQGIGLRPAMAPSPVQAIGGMVAQAAHRPRAAAPPPPSGPMGALKKGIADLFAGKAEKQDAPAGGAAPTESTPFLDADDAPEEAAEGSAEEELAQGPVYQAPPPPPKTSRRPEPSAPERKQKRADAPPKDRSEDRSEERAKQAPRGPATGAVPTPKTLSGKVLRRTDKELVIELTLTSGFDWPALLAALIHLAGARGVNAQVDASRTTRPGTLGAGVTVRVALTFGEGALGAADVEEVTLTTTGEPLVIRL